MLRQTIVIILAAILGAALLTWLIDFVDIVIAWIVSITAVTFITYGYDKAIAGTGRTRISERTLLILVLVGGTVGALAGMLLFRHKTQKRSFQAKLVVVLIVQILLLAGYFYFLR